MQGGALIVPLSYPLCQRYVVAYSEGSPWGVHAVVGDVHPGGKVAIRAVAPIVRENARVVLKP